MIPLPCRTKGGAPQLGGKGPGQTGPFGPWPDLDEDDPADGRAADGDPASQQPDH